MFEGSSICTNNMVFVNWKAPHHVIYNLIFINMLCMASHNLFSDMSFLSCMILYLLLHYELCRLWLLASIALNIRHFMSWFFNCFQNELCMFEGSSLIEKLVFSMVASFPSIMALCTRLSMWKSSLMRTHWWRKISDTDSRTHIYIYVYTQADINVCMHFFLTLET